ncbi:FAD:protein FMN transferase [Paenibacillus filicis]|uniref:FAD:protein FMN transferase n=1 Tax=Paenibacillus filicis TaxID=669464 RepID=A0ABU9DE49_9BACL
MATMHSVTRSSICMDTVITVQCVSSHSRETIVAGIERAFTAFRSVETACSRFDENSELRRLSLKPGVAQPVSAVLFEALRFARQLAETTEGVFDPTVGELLERKGFARHYLTGCTPPPLPFPSTPVSYRDFTLDEQDRTVTLWKPLLLDLGAVAKGLAVDWANKELEGHEGYLINAGGDLLAHGYNELGNPWRIGIRHPHQPGQQIRTLQISDMAVCTSGSYERRSPSDDSTHHLLDPYTEASSQELLSCTVVAPYAMLADGLSTAVFLLGQKRGLQLLETMNIEGLVISSAQDIATTTQMRRFLYE